MSADVHDRLRVDWLKRVRDTRQEDAEGSPTQGRISPSMQRILRESYIRTSR